MLEFILCSFAEQAYSNRAACYTKLGAFPEGLKDANKCIELDPSFAKGYSRKGTIQFFMKEYDKALETYQVCSLLHAWCDTQPSAHLLNKLLVVRKTGGLQADGTMAGVCWDSHALYSNFFVCVHLN
jgi:tetratricopeptide (TPR) repeat protein